MSWANLGSLYRSPRSPSRTSRQNSPLSSTQPTSLRPPNVDTTGSLPAGFSTAFFKALERDDEDSARQHLRDQVFEPGASTPTPTARVQHYIDTGEWDKKPVALLRIPEDGVCYGRVGADRPLRFCGRTVAECNAKTHTTSSLGQQPAGWYISGGSTNAGLFCSPHLLPAEAGGPITPKIAAHLSDSKAPFMLTVGQWKFVIEDWIETSASSAARDSQPELTPTIAKMPSEPQSKTVKLSTELDEAGDQGSDPPQRDDSPIFGFGRDADENPSGDDVFNSGWGGGGPPGAPGEQRPPSEDDHDDSPPSDLLGRMTALETTQARMFELITSLQTEVDNGRIETSMATQETAKLRTDYNGLYRTCRDFALRVIQLEKESRARAERISALEKRAPAGTAASATLRDGRTLEEALADLDATWQRLNFEVTDPTGDLSILKTQFATFQAKIDAGGGITCQGFEFSSPADLHAWFVRKTAPLGVWFDAFAMLHAIPSLSVGKSAAVKAREAQRKVKFNSALEASMVTSFDTTVPSPFACESDGDSEESPSCSVFDILKRKLKTHDAWKPLGQTTGLSKAIDDGVQDVSARIQQLRKRLTTDSEIIELSSGLRTDALLFCRELVLFINAQYEDLVTTTSYTKQEVWDMQLECLQKIIEELHAARGSVSDAAETQPSLYLWGMMQAWKIQERYRANDFKDDPALTGILVRRILFQRDTTVKTSLKELTAGQTRFTTQAEGMQKKILDNHRTAVNKIDSLEKKLKDKHVL